MHPPSTESYLWLIIVFGLCGGKYIVKKSELFNVHSTSFFNIPHVHWNVRLGIQLVYLC